LETKNRVLGNPKTIIRIKIFGRLKEGEMHGVAKEEADEDQIIK